MKKFFGEFKAFALRGNVIDLAVGVIIGGAFQTIVKSLVDDIIMPLVGLLIGDSSFLDKFVVLSCPDGLTKAQAASMSLAGAKEAGVSVLAYGSFVTAILNFIIMAFVIFLFVKGINNLHKLGKKQAEEAPAAPTTKVCPFCKCEIAIEATRCAHCTSEIPAEV